MADQTTPNSTPASDSLPVVEAKPVASEPTPAAVPVTPPVTPPVSEPTMPPVASAPAAIPTPAAPVVISADDASAAAPVQNNLDTHLENLNNEVQSLGTKLNVLGSAATPPISESATVPVNPASMPTPPPVTVPVTGEQNLASFPNTNDTLPGEKDTSTPAPTSMPASNVPPIASVTPTTPAPSAKSGSALNDIYARLDNPPKPAANKVEPVKNSMAMNEAPTGETQSSGAQSISEIVAIIGVIFFFIVLASPFLKQFISTSIFTMFKTVGWLTVIGTIFVSLVISMFAKGNGFLKVLLLILLVVAFVMYLGAINSSLVSSLEGLLGQLFSYYR